MIAALTNDSNFFIYVTIAGALGLFCCVFVNLYCFYTQYKLRKQVTNLKTHSVVQNKNQKAHSDNQKHAQKRKKQQHKSNPNQGSANFNGIRLQTNEPDGIKDADLNHPASIEIQDDGFVPGAVGVAAIEPHRDSNSEMYRQQVAPNLTDGTPQNVMEIIVTDDEEEEDEDIERMFDNDNVQKSTPRESLRNKQTERLKVRLGSIGSVTSVSDGESDNSDSDEVNLDSKKEPESADMKAGLGTMILALSDRYMANGKGIASDSEENINDMYDKSKRRNTNQGKNNHKFGIQVGNISPPISPISDESNANVQQFMD